MKAANALAVALIALGSGITTESRAAPVPEHSPLLLLRPANRIVGTWEYQVNVSNCETGQTLFQFRAASVFNAGGTLLDTNSQPPTTRGPAFGVWTYNPRARNWIAEMRLNRYNPDGSFAGVNEVRRTLTISRDGNHTSETFTGKILGLNEEVLVTTCGNSEGVRSL